MIRLIFVHYADLGFDFRIVLAHYFHPLDYSTHTTEGGAESGDNNGVYVISLFRTRLGLVTSREGAFRLVHMIS